MKKIIFIFAAIIFIFHPKCNSEFYSAEINKEINEQIKDINCENIINQLPEYSVNFFKDQNINIFSVKNLNFENSINLILSILKNKFTFPIKFLLSVSFILLVFCLFSSFFQYNQDIFKFILTCIVCTSISYPITKCVDNIIICLKIASNFLSCFIPIFMTFAISTGFPLSAAAFNSTILYCNQIIMEFSKNTLLPINNTMIGLCIISSLSTKIKTKKIFDIFYSIVKYLLIFFGTLISFIFSIQKIIGNSIDSVVSKELKFISSFMPIIGSVLSDAVITVRSSAKILESNVGAFGMISVFLIFLPSIIESYIWIITFQICEFFSSVFNLDNLEILFSSLRKTLNVSLSIVILFIFIFIFVTSATINIKL